MARSIKSVTEKVIESILFMQSNKYWTIEDLSTHLGITRRQAAVYVRDLSLYLPVSEVKPLRYGVGHGGLLPIVFTLNEPLWTCGGGDGRTMGE